MDCARSGNPPVPPSDDRIVSWCAMKSKSISNVRRPCGMGEVVSPLDVTYSVACQAWLIHGACARRTLPTICAQRCSAAHVSLHASSGRLGHVSLSGMFSVAMFLVLLRLTRAGLSAGAADTARALHVAVPY